MADHTHDIEPPEGVEIPPLPPLPYHVGPQDKMPDELKPQEPAIPDPPPHDIPPKPSDEEAGIDNTHRDAALSAVRAGKPLQKGTIVK